VLVATRLIRRRHRQRGLGEEGRHTRAQGHEAGSFQKFTSGLLHDLISTQGSVFVRKIQSLRLAYHAVTGNTCDPGNAIPGLCEFSFTPAETPANTVPNGTPRGCVGR